MKVVLKNMGCKGVLNLIERSESPHRKTQELKRTGWSWPFLGYICLLMKKKISSSLETFTSFLFFFKLKINSWKKYDHQSKFKSDIADHPASLIQYKNCTEKQWKDWMVSMTERRRLIFDQKLHRFPWVQLRFFWAQVLHGFCDWA